MVTGTPAPHRPMSSWRLTVAVPARSVTTRERDSAVARILQSYTVAIVDPHRFNTDAFSFWRLRADNSSRSDQPGAQGYRDRTASGLDVAAGTAMSRSPLLTSRIRHRNQTRVTSGVRSAAVGDGVTLDSRRHRCRPNAPLIRAIPRRHPAVSDFIVTVKQVETDVRNGRPPCSGCRLTRAGSRSSSPMVMT